MLKEIQDCFRSERILFTRHARDEMEYEELGEIRRSGPGSGLFLVFPLLETNSQTKPTFPNLSPPDSIFELPPKQRIWNQPFILGFPTTECTTGKVKRRGEKRICGGANQENREIANFDSI